VTNALAVDACRRTCAGPLCNLPHAPLHLLHPAPARFLSRQSGPRRRRSPALPGPRGTPQPGGAACLARRFCGPRGLLGARAAPPLRPARCSSAQRGVDRPALVGFEQQRAAPDEGSPSATAGPGTSGQTAFLPARLRLATSAAEPRPSVRPGLPGTFATNAFRGPRASPAPELARASRRSTMPEARSGRTRGRQASTAAARSLAGHLELGRGPARPSADGAASSGSSRAKRGRSARRTARFPRAPASEASSAEQACASRFAGLIPGPPRAPPRARATAPHASLAGRGARALAAPTEQPQRARGAEAIATGRGPVAGFDGPALARRQGRTRLLLLRTPRSSRRHAVAIAPPGFLRPSAGRDSARRDLELPARGARMRSVHTLSYCHFGAARALGLPLGLAPRQRLPCPMGPLRCPRAPARRGIKFLHHGPFPLRELDLRSARSGASRAHIAPHSPLSCGSRSR
jgi:hypothetical protein